MKNRILIATDAWEPQVSGVVTTLKYTIKQLRDKGYTVRTINPTYFKTISSIIYPQVRLSLCPYNKIESIINEFKPDYIQIETEGTIGLQTKKYCHKHNFRYISVYHTKMPEFLYAMIKFPLCISKKYMKWFHKDSSSVLVPSMSMKNDLELQGYKNVKLWQRGIDTEIFCPRKRKNIYLPPVFLYVGRVSKEKNLDSFLSLRLFGTKIIVGDGPYKDTLKERYPDVIFMGLLQKEKLSEIYNEADVFVFPSKLDTFGIVILEAIACGLPVAAYPVPGPIDILKNKPFGFLDNNLSVAINNALNFKRKDLCIQYAQELTWEKSTEQLLQILKEK